MDIHTLIRSEKDSISIPELRKMLGIGKTESYWLIQNRGIKTFQLRGCMRVRNKDFWDWYDNQTKHRLLQGPPPGRALQETSYSVRELTQLLAVSRDTIYALMKKDVFDTFQADNHTRITKNSFERWYKQQVRFRTAADREKEADALKASYSMPEMAHLLGIQRDTVYRILAKKDSTFEMVVIVKFPTVSSMTSTILVLKTPKTTSSVRKVYMPSAVARMLVEWKQAQDEKIELLGAEYQNYDLVFAGSLGMPTEASTINDALHRLIKEHDLPPIVFHSLRHSSITYKLKLNGGDIKAVQGDSGHSQAKMVTDTYSHILDDGRKNNALLFQEAFYEAKTEPKEKTPEGLSPETLSKMLANPEVMALLTALAKQMG